ncbi:MAG: uncharacterized protein QG567_1828 [Campylobacterota bacterium]|nr:uncharacterized protein [Campylobacterota bacterium]
MQEEVITIQKYAVVNKLTIFQVIKKINAGELESFKKDGQTFIVIKNRSVEPKAPQKMRRSELSIEDKETMLWVLSECEYGTLTLFDDEFPYGVPLNFAWDDDGVVFHGALEGKKIELIKKNPKASFCAVKSYSLIPSYFSDTNSACPATQHFASVMIRGVVEIINNGESKAKALNLLMQKLQPEKGYETIEYKNPIYTKMLDKTSVFKLIAQDVGTKINVGQSASTQKREKIIEKLTQRKTSRDIETLKIINSLNNQK